MDNTVRPHSGALFGAIFLLTFIMAACSFLHGDSQDGIDRQVISPTSTIVTDAVSTLTVDALAEEKPTPTTTPTAVMQNMDATEEIADTETTRQTETIVMPTETPEVVYESLLPLAYEDLPPFTQWYAWPALPIVSETAREIYQNGLQAGRNPHAVSVFGDCQSVPHVFWGEFDNINYEWADENRDLIQTVDWFRGSFRRNSVTARDGTTAAAILWEQWIPEDNESCEWGETPLQCEVRLNNPSIVFISVGTHWELRNERYLRKILDQLIEMGILPVIATKADQREGSDGWVNQQMVEIALEYQLPVWNFWATAQDIENGGLIEGDTMMLTDEALEVRRFSGLQALHTIRLQLIRYQENN